MSYLSDNLLRAYPFRHGPGTVYDSHGWEYGLSQPQDPVYVYGGGQIPARALWDYAGGTGSAYVRTGSTVPVNLFADVSITVAGTVSEPVLAFLQFRAEMRELVSVFRMRHDDGLLYVATVTGYPEQGRGFVKNASVYSVYFTAGSRWWHVLGTGEFYSNYTVKPVDVRVRSVMSAETLSRILDYSGNVLTLETFPELSLEDRALLCAGTGSGVGFRVQNPGPEGDVFSATVTGVAVLASGYNCRLSVADSEVVLDAGPGLGGGRVPCPGSESNAPDGIVVGEGGDLEIVTDDCHVLVPHVPSQTVYIFGNCASCCSCGDYSNFFKALKRYGEKWGETWDALDAAADRYRTIKSKYDNWRRTLAAVTAKITGSVSRGQYYEDGDGYPQWALEPSAGQILDKPFPVTMRVAVTIHDPTPRWYDATNAVQLPGNRRRVRNLRLRVSRGFGLNLQPEFATVNWYAANQPATAPSGSGKLLPVETGSGSWEFSVDMADLKAPDSVLLDPCATFDFTVNATSAFTLGITQPVLRRAYATVLWDVITENDGNLDGLPDAADPDLTSAKRTANATQANLILELS